MKDGNEPKNPDGAMKPQQQTDESFGSTKGGQLDGRNSPGDADRSRGSEPDTRGAGRGART